MAALNRDQYVYMAKLAEQAERYEEMVQYMEQLVTGSTPAAELTVEERNLLSVAYKNVIGSLRAAWRIVSSIEQKEESRKNDEHVTLVRDYRSKVETELSNVCAGILKLLDSHLIPSAVASESKVFYLKMKGDYHRYLAEFKAGDERKAAAEDTMLAYKTAQDIALADLSPTHPIRLGLALNFSVFYYEILSAIVDALRTGQYNCYSPGDGVEEARRALAKYMNRDLTNKLTGDDIFFAVGCNQAIEIILTALQRPGANILLPRPGFPHYEARAVFSKYEVRHFDLLPEKDWEIDLEGIKALADENTVALVIINPNNPCGNVYTHEHLKKVAETARRLGVMVISDEVYDHCIYGCSPFVPMGKFSSIVPVLTLGALSKGWYVPGWRLGWMAMNDPYGVFKRTGVVDSIRSCQYITPDAVTFLQAALPGILENTKEEFFQEKLQLLRENLDFSLDKIKEMPALTCVQRPESCTYLLLKMNLSMLKDIEDDHDFCLKLAKEEAVIVLPGDALGLKNWIRISLGVDRSVLEDGLGRLKAYYDRHAARCSY